MRRILIELQLVLEKVAQSSVELVLLFRLVPFERNNKRILSHHAHLRLHRNHRTRGPLPDQVEQ